jgi:ribonuclease HI
MKFIVFTDGGARGNPGPAAIGAVIANEKGEAVKKYGQAIGEATNNEAEYQAVIFALKKIKALFGKTKAKQSEIEVCSDSELMVRQMNHQYKIQEENLQPFFFKIWNLMTDFKKVEFRHIGRGKNKEADRLVNQALDEQGREISLPGMGQKKGF